MSGRGCLEAERLALRFFDGTAEPGQPLEPPHLVNRFFQPAETLGGSQPQPSPDVVAAGAGKIPGVFLSVRAHRGILP